MTVSPGDAMPAPPAPGAPPQAAAGTQARIERASALTDELLERGAPWSPQTSSNIVFGEGIVVAVAGLWFLFQPFGGSSTLLQLAGLLLLGAALIGTFQLWRGRTRPGMEVLAAFRAGSGVTVGLAIIVATFFVPVTEVVTASLAVVVGIGFVVFGIAGIAASFARRDQERELPLVTLVFNATLALVGIVLALAGPGGAASVDGVFRILGIALIAGGIALAGYGWTLHQRGV